MNHDEIEHIGKPNVEKNLTEDLIMIEELNGCFRKHEAASNGEEGRKDDI